MENWERSRSEGSLGGVNSGVCVSDALDLLTGTLRRGFLFSAVTVQECGVSKAWSWTVYAIDPPCPALWEEQGREREIWAGGRR